MSRTPAAVLAELLALSPPGDALPLGNQPGDVWPLWLAPLAAEVARFEALAEQQMVEVDPRQAEYLLADFLRMLGPDPYGIDTATMTVAQQQAYAYQRLTARGGQSPAYFVALAAALGVTITITDQIPVSECGAAECGDELSADPQNLFWIVNLPATDSTGAECGDVQCGEDLGDIVSSPVVPFITAQQPEHGQVVFAYGGA